MQRYRGWSAPSGAPALSAPALGRLPPHRREIGPRHGEEFFSDSERERRIVEALAGVLRLLDASRRVHTPVLVRARVPVERGHADDEYLVGPWGIRLSRAFA